MSKARLVITAVVVEGRSQGEAARAYGVSQGWVSRLVARYRAEGEAAFQPRSRRPQTSPTATSASTVELIVRLRKRLSEQGLDAGPDTIAWHLRQHHQLAVSRATISRILTAHGLVTPQPKKRPRSSYVRFQAALPNQTWQADFTHYRLADATDAEVLTWLDDHSRYALHVSAHAPVTGPVVLAAFRAAVAAHGVPASTLTDNGMVFTTRLAGGKGGRNALEAELRRLHVAQKNASPNHPTTCGKVERFQQTLKKWLATQPVQPATLAELQALLDQFTTTTSGRTGPCPTAPPPPSPTAPSPRPSRPPAATTTPTPASATTASTTAAWSPCAWPASCTTSASAEPTPEPTCSCSSTTSTSASSTPPPANCSAS
jgi:transposase InsO family protein